MNSIRLVRPDTRRKGEPARRAPRCASRGSRSLQARLNRALSIGCFWSSLGFGPGGPPTPRRWQRGPGVQIGLARPWRAQEDDYLLPLTKSRVPGMDADLTRDSADGTGRVADPMRFSCCGRRSRDSQAGDGLGRRVGAEHTVAQLAVLVVAPAFDGARRRERAHDRVPG
jgi:hypothetical protein